MFTLIKSDYFNEKIKNKLETLEITPVILFDLELSDKNTNKKNIEELLNKKQKLNPKYSAIRILLTSFDNTIVGTINFLKKEFDIVIGFGGLNKINRFFLEETQIDFLQDPQNSFYKTKIDFIHHFNSGLNHILCRFAEEREIGFIYTLNFFQSNKSYIPKEIGRINQNIRFHRKYNNPLILNFDIKNISQVKNEDELINISQVFDMSISQRYQIAEILEKKIMTNNFKKSDNYICDGIIKTE